MARAIFKIYSVFVVTALLFTTILSINTGVDNVEMDGSGEPIQAGPTEPNYGTSTQEFESDIPGTFVASTRAENKTDYTISDKTIIENLEWVIDRLVYVEDGGELIIINSSVLMDTSEDVLFIYVYPGGKLTISNSSIGLAEPSTSSINGYALIVEGEIVMENSSMSYSGYTNLDRINKLLFDGFYIERGSAYFNNISFNANNNIRIHNSTLILNDTSITNNNNGLILYQTNFTIDNCTFKNNNVDLAVDFSNDFEILNSVFSHDDEYIYLNKEYTMGIDLFGCSGTIYNCYIYSKHTGLEVNGGTLEINNSLFYFNTREITAYECTVDIYNTTIDNPYASDYFTFNEVILNEWGIYGMNTDMYVYNLTLNNCSNGLAYSISNIYISNSTLTNSNAGLNCEFSHLEADNLTLTGNDRGAEVWFSTANISNCQISDNTIGITSYYTDTMLDSNRIINNTAWGIVTPWYIKDIEFVGDNFPIPAGWSTDQPTNGNGNLVLIRELYVEIKDLYNNPLGNVKIDVESDCEKYYGDDDILYKVDNPTTDPSGWCHLGWLIEYVIITGYDRVYCGDYTITASYMLDEKLEIKNSTVINLKDFYDYKIHMQLALPNFYLDESEFKLSHSSISAGETLTVTTVIHYMGQGNLDFSGVEVKFYVDFVEIQSVKVEGLSKDKTSQELTFTWEAETGVPMEKKVGQRMVQVSIDIPESWEYQKGNISYRNDNSLSKSIDINIEEEDEGWVLTLDEEGVAAFVCVIFIIINIIVFVAVWRRYKKKRKEKKAKEDEEE
ncbi:MAG: hypothetical protein JSV49_03825 [Thermoplasmata archaeon]|nr:MAG: hypothetical protein JSV49_03825 [Thermoplasmata archaeon]